MFATIKGHYEQGKIFLDEDAPVNSKTDVIITFLTNNTANVSNKKRMSGGLKGKVSIPDDFNEPLDDLKDYM